jgi:hypothetical protein
LTQKLGPISPTCGVYFPVCKNILLRESGSSPLVDYSSQTKQKRAFGNNEGTKMRLSPCELHPLSRQSGLLRPTIPNPVIPSLFLRLRNPSYLNQLSSFFQLCIICNDSMISGHCMRVPELRLCGYTSEAHFNGYFRFSSSLLFTYTIE